MSSSTSLSPSKRKHQTEKQNHPQPATPPLSPRKDINFLSPSPLRIRNDVSVYDKGSTLSMANEASNRGGNQNQSQDPDQDKENMSWSGAPGDAEDGEPARPSIPAATEKDLKVSLLAMSIEDVGGNAVAAEIENSTAVTAPALAPATETASSTISSASATTPATTPAATAAGPSAFKTDSNDSGAAAFPTPTAAQAPATTYISPSDALMSPCTQKLSAFKGRKLARSIGSVGGAGSIAGIGGIGGGGPGVVETGTGVKGLFGGKILRLQRERELEREREMQMEKDGGEGDGGGEEGKDG